jgi:hypothetical protein
MKQSVSVIMVSYHTGPILTRSIEQVLAQEGLKELFLVDNGNSDAVADRLDSLAAKNTKLSIVRGQGNVGFAAACNLGAKKASGDYILLLNPDCLIPENALKTTVTALEKNPKAWLLGISMVGPDGDIQGGAKRNLLTPFIAFTEVFQLWRFQKTEKHRLNLTQHPEDIAPEIVPAISGAFMLIKKSRYTTLKGIDEDYFFHVEDLDFCLKIHNAGGKILFLPAVKAVHYRSTSNVSSLFVEWNKAKGFTHYFSKHFQNKYGKLFSLLAVTAIYTRLAVRSVVISVKRVFGLKNGDAAEKRHTQQLAFLKQLDTQKSRAAKPTLAKHAPVLVIGSTGQVGLSIVGRLLARNMDTIALFHSATIDYCHPKLSWLQGSLENETFYFGKHAPKSVVSTAAIWLLPAHIPSFAKAGVERLICFSSTSIEGKATTQNPYEKELVGQFKHAEAEVARLCDAHGIAWTIFRPTMIYGLGLDRNVCSIANVINKIGFFPINTPGKGLRQPVHTLDLADAVVNALDNKKSYSGTYNLTGNEKLSYTEMVERIFTVMGKPKRIVKVRILPFLLDVLSLFADSTSVNGEIAKRMNQDLVFDNSKAKKELGYKPRNFMEAGKHDLGLEKEKAA